MKKILLLLAAILLTFSCSTFEEIPSIEDPTELDGSTEGDESTEE